MSPPRVSAVLPALHCGLFGDEELGLEGTHTPRGTAGSARDRTSGRGFHEDLRGSGAEMGMVSFNCKTESVSFKLLMRSGTQASQKEIVMFAVLRKLGWTQRVGRAEWGPRDQGRTGEP